LNERNDESLLYITSFGCCSYVFVEINVDWMIILVLWTYKTCLDSDDLVCSSVRQKSTLKAWRGDALCRWSWPVPRQRALVRLSGYVHRVHWARSSNPQVQAGCDTTMVAVWCRSFRKAVYPRETTTTHPGSGAAYLVATWYLHLLPSYVLSRIPLWRSSTHNFCCRITSIPPRKLQGHLPITNVWADPTLPTLTGVSTDIDKPYPFDHGIVVPAERTLFLWYFLSYFEKALLLEGERHCLPECKRANR
jgi:hypothetical protein